MITAFIESNPSDDSCPALIVDNLSAGYPGQPRAIENVSFAVSRGERIAIIGPNGAGKSTLFKALVGLISHSTGAISLHGQDCRTSHTGIGYVPQHETIDWNFPVNVRDVVMMGRIRCIGWLHWPRQRDWDAIDWALQQVGIFDLRRRQIGQLSGGQRRRVFIARALAQATDVLLLDEPFTGVDMVAEQEIMETLDRLQANHITVLLATHDLNLAATRADRLLILKKRVIAYGKSDVLRPDILQAVYSDSIQVFQQGDQFVLVADKHRH